MHIMSFVWAVIMIILILSIYYSHDENPKNTRRQRCLDPSKTFRYKNISQVKDLSKKLKVLTKAAVIRRDVEKRLHIKYQPEIFSCFLCVSYIAFIFVCNVFLILFTPWSTKGHLFNWKFPLLLLNKIISVSLCWVHSVCRRHRPDCMATCHCVAPRPNGALSSVWLEESTQSFCALMPPPPLSLSTHTCFLSKACRIIHNSLLTVSQCAHSVLSAHSAA